MTTLRITWLGGYRTSMSVRRYRFIAEDGILHVQHEDYEWSECETVIAVEEWR